jgi:hypothetical protein
MRRLLMIAAAAVALGYSVSAANAAPVTNMLETVKAVHEGSTIQKARHYRRGHHRYHRWGRERCWWRDRWLCRYFW